MQPRLGEREQRYKRTERNSLLHRVTVKFPRFGVLTEVGNFGVVPDEGTDARGVAVVLDVLAAFGTTEGGVGGAGLGEVREGGVFAFDELGGTVVCNGRGRNGEVVQEKSSVFVPFEGIGKKRLATHTLPADPTQPFSPSASKAA
jgi:hypothetical protein